MTNSVMSLAPSTKVLRQFSNIEDVPFEEINETVTVKVSPSAQLRYRNYPRRASFPLGATKS